MMHRPEQWMRGGSKMLILGMLLGMSVRARAASTDTASTPVGTITGSSAPGAGFDLPKPPPGFRSPDMGAAAASTNAAVSISTRADYDLPKPPPGFHSSDMDLLTSTAAAPSVSGSTLSAVAESAIAISSAAPTTIPVSAISSATAKAAPAIPPSVSSTAAQNVGVSVSTPTAAGQELDLPKPPPGFHSADMGIVFPSSVPVQGNATTPGSPASASATPSPAPVPIPSGPGWFATESSVVLYDSSGTRMQEIGLAQWKENDNGIQKRHMTRGGACANGRFAWSWEKVETLAPAPGGAPPLVLDSTQILRYLGTDGQELWHDRFADSPVDDVGPAVMSSDGETTLVLRHTADGWTAVIYNFTGLPVLEARGDGLIQLALISPQGRFGLVRWQSEGQPPSYVFIDIDNNAQHPIPITNIPTAPMRVDDEGRVWAGDKQLYSGS